MKGEFLCLCEIAKKVYCFVESATRTSITLMSSLWPMNPAGDSLDPVGCCCLLLIVFVVPSPMLTGNS